MKKKRREEEKTSREEKGKSGKKTVRAAGERPADWLELLSTQLSDPLFSFNLQSFASSLCFNDFSSSLADILRLSTASTTLDTLTPPRPL